MFLHSSSSPEAGWVLLGTAIRMAMDVGAHRQSTYGPKPTVVGEQWKRAFWYVAHVLFQLGPNYIYSCLSLGYLSLWIAKSPAI
jgi:hypothetical protein